MKLIHKLLLPLVAVGALCIATPAQAGWFHHRHFIHAYYGYGYGYPTYYGPGYYAYGYPYYYGPRFGGGFAFGGHGYYHRGFRGGRFGHR